MNIFALDNDSTAAARSLCDQHLGKMLLEATQLLCNAFNEPQGNLLQQWLALTPTERAKLVLLPYKRTHHKHPCSVWACASTANWIWLLQYALIAWHEYEMRFGKRHGAGIALNWLVKTFPRLPTTGRTPFAQAMPEQYRGDDAVAAYRRYYAAEKMILRGKPVTWTRRERPAWLLETA